MAKKKKSNRSRGRPAKIVGFKLAFLQRHKLACLAAAAPTPGCTTRDMKDKMGRFYDGITNLLIHKWGHDVDLETNPETDIEDPAEALASIRPSDPSWTEEQREHYEKKYKILRTVSSLCIIVLSITDPSFRKSWHGITIIARK